MKTIKMKHNTNLYAALLACAIILSGSVSASAREWSERTVERASMTQLRNKMEIRRLPHFDIGSAGKAIAAPARAEENFEIVLSEDFSKFTAGSVDAPDESVILDSDGIIMADYVHTLGWAGINLKQAGGCCYIADGMQALLATPFMNLSGNDGNFIVRVSYRAQIGETMAYVQWGEGQTAVSGVRMTVTEEWSDFEFECTGGSRQMSIQFYGDAPIFVDDIYVMQESGTVVPAEIPAPEAMVATDISATGFTANWTAVAEATGYLLDVFCFEDNQPQYVFEDLTVTGTSYAVDGLDDGRLYYYSVQATDGERVSDESSIIAVIAPSASIAAPVVQSPEDVSNEGFRARWMAVDNAAYYQLSTLSYYEIPDNGVFVVEDEHFDGIVGGTVDNPLYNDMSTLLDDYTVYPNWEAVTTMSVEGMIGLANYYSFFGIYSELYTPVYQVYGNENDGAIHAMVTARRVNCSPETDLGIALVDAATGELVGDWQLVSFGSDTQKVFEFSFPSCDAYYLVLAYADNRDEYGTTGVVYIDDVKITQNLSAGATLLRLYRNDVAYNNSFYVTTSDKREGERFAYAVCALTNGTEGIISSEMSAEMPVDYNGSVEIPDADFAGDMRVYGGDGCLTVSVDCPSVATVYDIVGRLAARVPVGDGECRIDLPAGMYVVEIDDVVIKVIVR